MRVAIAPIRYSRLARPLLSTHFASPRTISTTRVLQQQAARQSPSPHPNFYKTHGRALFKALTLAFLSYQFFYWTWLTFETEAMKDEKNHEIQSLQNEVRLLEEGRKSHRPGEVIKEQEANRLLNEMQQK